MKKLMSLLLAGLLLATAAATAAAPYANNRAPLREKPFVKLPLGAIRAEGWLRDQLQRQADGLTGHLDSVYPEVMGPRNGWLGGDGDVWERGPYWIDGLLPLAYILDDGQLKAKVQPWVEWALQSQREDGYFGPAQDYPYEAGLQRDNSADWWPRMVVLKILQQYYSATGDRRVVDFMTRYFRYQLKTLPEKPLGHWTFWARRGSPRPQRRGHAGVHAVRLAGQRAPAGKHLPLANGDGRRAGSVDSGFARRTV